MSLFDTLSRVTTQGTAIKFCVWTPLVGKFITVLRRFFPKLLNEFSEREVKGFSNRKFKIFIIEKMYKIIQRNNFEMKIKEKVIMAKLGPSMV